AADYFVYSLSLVSQIFFDKFWGMGHGWTQMKRMDADFLWVEEIATNARIIFGKMVGRDGYENGNSK
ncbi:hypothetical protein, partial [Flavobacterium sp. TSSA_36]|uniref:hypothetical protein n=1 Tax=Flavobacterium sp. TSSA_36 TaxID=3447669 RepID=UPI003F3DDCD5